MINTEHMNVVGYSRYMRFIMENCKFWNQDQPERNSNFYGLYIKCHGCIKWPSQAVDMVRAMERSGRKTLFVVESMYKYSQTHIEVLKHKLCISKRANK